MYKGIIYEITSHCNLDCGFCYNSWDHQSGNTAPLDRDSMQLMLKNVLSESEAQWIVFTGGEPLLHPHLVEAVRFCRQDFPSLKIGMASNGTLLDQHKISTLQQAGLDYMEIPVLASDERLYHKMTGYYQLTQVREAISLIKQYQLRLNVSVMLSSLNYTDLTTIIEMAYAFGADIITLNRYTPTGKGGSQAAKYQLNREELIMALELAESKSAALDIPVSISLPVRDCDISHDIYPHLLWAPCVCGKEKWVIDPWGNLRSCEQNEEVLGSLLDHSFNELSHRPSVQNFLDNNRFEDCQDKLCYEFCRGGCRFEAE